MTARQSRLGLMLASAVAVAALLSACDDSDKEAKKVAPIYTTVDECVAGGNEDGVCKEALDRSKDAHTETAPRFMTLAECEAQFGRCGSGARPAASGGGGGGGDSSFMPMMTGFMIGHMLGSASAPVSQPVYVNRNGYAYSGNTQVARCGRAGDSCRSGGGGYVWSGSTTGSGSSTSTWYGSGGAKVQTAVAPSSGPSGMSVSPPSARGGFGGTAASVASSAGSSASSGG